MKKLAGRYQDVVLIGCALLMILGVAGVLGWSLHTMIAALERSFAITSIAPPSADVHLEAADEVFAARGLAEGL